MSQTDPENWLGVIYRLLGECVLKDVQTEPKVGRVLRFPWAWRENNMIKMR
jgi:hypothetical protein